MTKKELVKLLNLNFADSDVIFIRYDDDQGERIGEIADVKEVKEHYENSHLEVMEDGIWTAWKDPFVHPASCFANGKWRRVVDQAWSETHKCICVK